MTARSMQNYGLRLALHEPQYHRTGQGSAGAIHGVGLGIGVKVVEPSLAAHFRAEVPSGPHGSTSTVKQ